MGYGSKSINDWVDDIMKWAAEKGWHEENIQGEAISEKLMLVITEVSEAMEEHRKPEIRKNGYNYVYQSGDPSKPWNKMRDLFLRSEMGKEPIKPEGFPTELADAVIRIMHLAGMLNIDLESAIRDKLDYNRTRKHRHGGRAC